MVAAAFDLESALRRDRLVVVIALVAVIVLSWAYILAGAGMGMSAFEMTQMTQSVGVSDSGPNPACRRCRREARPPTA